MPKDETKRVISFWFGKTVDEGTRWAYVFYLSSYAGSRSYDHGGPIYHSPGLRTSVLHCYHGRIPHIPLFPARARQGRLNGRLILTRGVIISSVSNELQETCQTPSDRALTRNIVITRNFSSFLLNLFHLHEDSSSVSAYAFFPGPNFRVLCFLTFSDGA